MAHVNMTKASETENVNHDNLLLVQTPIIISSRVHIISYFILTEQNHLLFFYYNLSQESL